MKFAQKFSLLVLALSMVVAGTSFAAGVPDCLDDQNHPLGNMDAQVLRMKTQTPNGYKTRALVDGIVTKIYSDATCHHHFRIQIGTSVTDTLEVIYNEGFGGFPPFSTGAHVVACGDYITSNRQTNYPASPDGAIIHWVHMSPNPQRHPSGFLVINGVVTGQTMGSTSNCH